MHSRQKWRSFYDHLLFFHCESLGIKSATFHRHVSDLHREKGLMLKLNQFNNEKKKRVIAKLCLTLLINLSLQTGAQPELRDAAVVSNC